MDDLARPSRCWRSGTCGRISSPTPGVVKAVEDVSFTLDAGETLAVVGESGSGKSVTSLSIMGLIPNPPGRIVGGEILFRTRDGSVVDLAKLPAKALRRLRGRDIAMIFQEPMTSLDPVFTVGDQIAEAAALHLGHESPRGDEARAGDARAGRDPGREQRIGEYPHQLSGGMRQRVMIALALSCNPSLLIADEPTTALDVTIQAQILALLDKLRREIGMAVLFITHNLGVVAEIADRVVVMYGGRVVEEGGVHALFRGAAASVYARPARLPAAARAGRSRRRRRQHATPERHPRPGREPARSAAGLRVRAALRARAAECAAAMPPLDAILTRASARAALRWSDAVNATRMLAVRGLKKYFGHGDRPVRAVDDVSFEIARAKSLGLVGESGSGKSTIGRAC